MATTSVSAFWNGQKMPLVDVRVSVLDRAYLFGDAAYEVIRIYRGEPWLFSEHEQRLKRSLAELRIEVDLGDLRGKIATLLRLDQKQDAAAYIQISRGTATRTHVPPPTLKANELIYLQDIDDLALAEKRQQGIRVCLSPDERWGRCDIKSVNLLGNTLAAQGAVARGFADALLVDRDGGVTEGTHSSFFAVFADTLVTPPLGPGLLPGITRAFVLKVAAKAGIKTQERRMAAAELGQASEMFFTGTVAEILPIVGLDERPIGRGEPGPLTRRLHLLFQSEIP